MVNTASTAKDKVACLWSGRAAELIKPAYPKVFGPPRQIDQELGWWPTAKPSAFKGLIALTTHGDKQPAFTVRLPIVPPAEVIGVNGAIRRVRA
jgi:hypothetical protein